MTVELLLSARKNIFVSFETVVLILTLKIFSEVTHRTGLHDDMKEIAEMNRENENNADERRCDKVLPSANSDACRT